jgi:PHD/YefM family antitoxin component YafN of YafNO toxin-antitoxin module
MIRVVKNLIKIGKERVVILPLKDWKKIIDYIEELEAKERYLKALKESEGKKGITLNELKKKYNLRTIG